VLAFVRTFTRDRATAEEIVVDTLTAVWREASRFRGTSSLSTWILGIARHKALDAVRRGRFARRAESIEHHANLVDESLSSDVMALAACARQQLDEALQNASQEHREILHLVFVEELAYGEIATLLGIPENTVKTRVHYAKRCLRTYLEPTSGLPQATRHDDRWHASR
jgi:RNA polymerase sigma-70 factor (ECF subfamily)